MARYTTKGCEAAAATLNTLLRLSPSYEEGTALVDKMSSKRLRPNVVTWNTVLSLAETEAERADALRRFAESGVVGTGATLDVLEKWVRGEGRRGKALDLLRDVKLGSAKGNI